MKPILNRLAVAVRISGAVALVALLYNVGVFALVMPRAIALEPMPAWADAAGLGVGLSILISGLFHLVALLTLCLQVKQSHRLGAGPAILCIMGVISLFLLGADVVLLGDIGKEYKSGLATAPYDQDGKAAVEYINAADCTLVAVDSAEGSVTVDFTPCVRWPVPQLEAGKSLTETFEVAYDKTIAGSKNRKMKMRTTAKSVRLPDETVETPAGIFQQCVHVAVRRSTTVDGVDAQIVVQSDVWLSPRVGMVKEVLHYSAICAPDGRVIKPERRSVSILRSFKSASTACMATR